MSRPSRPKAPVNPIERRRQDSLRALPLRQLHPQLSALRVAFEFSDGTTRAPSPQAYVYYPAAKAFFRYTCPCHGCNGEFDLSTQVEEFARCADPDRKDLQLSLACPGQRARDIEARFDCPIRASIRVSASTLTDPAEEPHVA